MQLCRAQESLAGAGEGGGCRWACGGPIPPALGEQGLASLLRWGGRASRPSCTGGAQGLASLLRWGNRASNCGPVTEGTSVPGLPPVRDVGADSLEVSQVKDGYRWGACRWKGSQRAGGQDTLGAGRGLGPEGSGREILPTRTWGKEIRLEARAGGDGGARGRVRAAGGAGRGGCKGSRH